MMKRLNYFCVVEGKQEELYLKRISALLRDFPNRTVTFNTVIGNAKELKKASYEYSKVCVFDYDFNNIEFENNLNTCIELNSCRKSNDSKIFHAYSNACFDLWLLLHKKFANYSVVKADAYVNDVRKAYSLPNEANIKSEKVIEKILNQIMLSDVKKAIIHAEKIRDGKLFADKHNVSGNEYYYDNPDFSIDVFIKHILIEAGEL